MGEHTIEAIERDQRLLINRGMRVQPDWPDIEMAWENLRLALQQTIVGLAQCQESLNAPGAAEMVNYELVRAEVDSLLQEMQVTVNGMSEALEKDDPQRIVWLECERSDGSLVVSSVPLAVDGLLKENLYEGVKSLVLTGATLQAQGSFAYIQERLGLEDAETLALGSPFDYRRAALVLTPQRHAGTGRGRSTSSRSRQAIADLVRASGGRALVLFTSHSGLRAAHRLVGEIAAGRGDPGARTGDRRLGAATRAGTAIEPEHGAVRDGELLGGRGHCRRRAVAADRGASAVQRAVGAGVRRAVRACTTSRSSSTRCRRRCCASSRVSGG